MWDLNDEPDRRAGDESEGCSFPKTAASRDDDKGKGWVLGPSVSNSSSSALVLEDASDEDVEEEEAGDGTPTAKWRGSLGFCEGDLDQQRPAVTRQFFPTKEGEDTGLGGGGGFPQAQWLGVRFVHSDPAAVAEQGAGSRSGGGCSSPKQQLPPMLMKKSRRGPRSRSSQYRGVTFYRRTGRWESHIW